MADLRVDDDPPVRRLQGRANDGAATRRSIMTAAAVLFSEHGYPSTSLNDITAATGLTKGAVYWHFSSKEEIALSIVHETYERWPKVLADIAAAHDDVLQALVAVMNRIAQEFMHDPATQATKRLLFELPPATLSELPRPYVQWELLVTSLLQDGQAKGQISAHIPPAQAARVMVASFYGMDQISYQLERRADLLERVSEFWTLVWPALAPTEPIPAVGSPGVPSSG
ncbi:ScbR family autoregulator-binding transcription factor [Blastococcus saxobsidens]|uniref:TetR family transcriptional regulator n=1 Tax=Blastococcus saxobsidens TaxID=138336 RepID=A0A4V6MFK1_9ACTN|nr:ScbR family autoregulator-binding transcription factor [Blastococcus saxobsidens]RZU31546.1 TetR family transcriptional regulator [Blastococcus saxobsidens]